MSLDNDNIQRRYETLLDALLSADRHRRGYLAFDRVSEIYSLYFHASAHQLAAHELPTFLRQFTSPMAPDEGVHFIDYMSFATAVRKRDQDALKRDTAAARARERTERSTGFNAGGAPAKTAPSYEIPFWPMQ